MMCYCVVMRGAFAVLGRVCLLCTEGIICSRTDFALDSASVGACRGEGFVCFQSDEDLQAGLKFDRKYMGKRCVANGLLLGCLCSTALAACNLFDCGLLQVC